MIHYENMTKEQVISILKDTLEYVEEKDKELERINKALLYIKEYIEEMQVWCVEFDTFGVDTKGLEYIVNEALGSDKE